MRFEVTVSRSPLVTILKIVSASPRRMYIFQLEITIEASATPPKSMFLLAEFHLKLVLVETSGAAGASFLLMWLLFLFLVLCLSPFVFDGPGLRVYHDIYLVVHSLIIPFI